VYGPVCPVVWEGEGREAFPYPDYGDYLIKLRAEEWERWHGPHNIDMDFIK